MRYNDEVARGILAKVNEKGWNAYDSTDTGTLGPDRVIRENLADETLQVNRKYVLMPRAEDPKDPRAVFDALETFGVKRDRRQPEITVEHVRMPWTGFSLREGSVEVNNPAGQEVNYEKFFEALETMTSAA